MGWQKRIALTLTNANFGIFKERDNLTDKIIEVKEQHCSQQLVLVMLRTVMQMYSTLLKSFNRTVLVLDTV